LIKTPSRLRHVRRYAIFMQSMRYVSFERAVAEDGTLLASTRESRHVAAGHTPTI
jgi:hypothetical protein